jgi:hypothetical protein
VFLSDGISKTLQKTLCKKSPIEKKLQKNRPKIQNRLFLEIILSCFWAFLGEGSREPGVQNYTAIKKISGKQKQI